MEFQYFELTNGIRVVYKNIPAYVSHLGLIINAGSRDENNDEQGIAHFIEHVIFKGTEKRKAFHILSYMENVGGEINAYTSKEETCIYATFLNEHLERASDLISDIFYNSTFPAKELEKEKDVVIDEINSYKDSPSEAILDDFEDLIFENHPLGKNILGTPKHVKSFDKDKIKRFIKANYLSNQIVISYIGNVEFKKFTKIITKYFDCDVLQKGDLKRNPCISAVNKHVVKKMHLHQSHCVIGTAAYPHKHKLKNEMVLLNNIFGGPGLNSRLNLAIREKYGFCYTIESNYTSLFDTGLFSIYLGTDVDYLEKTKELVYKELEKIKNQKLGTLQLHRAKQQIKGQIAIASEHNSNDMLAIGKSYMIYNKVDSLEEMYNKVDIITSEGILEAANEIFDVKNFNSLTFQPK